jgi:hypothetical protein
MAGVVVADGSTAEPMVAVGLGLTAGRPFY